MGAEIRLDRAPAGHFQPLDAPKARQVLRLKPQRLDGEVSLQGLFRPGDFLRRLAARHIRSAEAHVDDLHAAHRVISGKAFRRGLPDKLDAFFLGVLNLAL